jgi:DNA-binding NarL/FixJ family response regulator
MNAARDWGLSVRQTEVLQLLAAGLTNARIGAQLEISQRTAEDHVAAILEKAQVGTRSELIARLIG